MGNSKSKDRAEISKEMALSPEEHHVVQRMFRSICHDHSTCNKEDLRVSFKLRHYE
jgi:hypothetical protein